LKWLVGAVILTCQGFCFHAALKIHQPIEQKIIERARKPPARKKRRHPQSPSFQGKDAYYKQDAWDARPLRWLASTAVPI
jgi:hypothetical protein